MASLNHIVSSTQPPRRKYVKRARDELELKSSDYQILRIISNPANMRILQLLEQDALNTRRLAQLTGIGESHVSEHLRIMERAGIIRFDWRRVGNKNLKFYSFDINPLVVDLGSVGVKIEATRK